MNKAIKDEMKVLERYVRRCVCGRKVKLYMVDGLFEVSCPKCGRNTEQHNEPLPAVIEWNANPTISMMLVEK